MNHQRDTVSTTLVAVLVACVGLVAACSDQPQKFDGPDDYAGDPAILEGITRVEPILTTKGSDLEGIVDLQQTATSVVEVEYVAGIACGNEPLAQEPAAVSAEYRENDIKITIDPHTRGCGTSDSMEIGFRMRLTLKQPISGREIIAELTTNTGPVQ